MKRIAIMLGTGTVAVAALLSGLAYGDPLDDAIPAVPAVPGVPALPDAGGLVTTVTETLAGVGLPLEIPALPAVPDLTDPAAALATVQEALAATGLALPTQDPVMAVPENVVVGNLNETVDRVPLYLTAVPGVTGVIATAEGTLATADEAVATAQETMATAEEAVATVEQTVAGLGLPLDVPALPAVSLPDATTLLTTVEETVATLPLGLGGILPEL